MRKLGLAVTVLAALGVALLLLLSRGADEGAEAPTDRDSPAETRPADPAEPIAEAAETPEADRPQPARTPTETPPHDDPASSPPPLGDPASPPSTIATSVPPGTKTPAPNPIGERSVPVEEPPTDRQVFERQVGELFLDALMHEVFSCLELMRGLDVEMADSLVFNLRAVPIGPESDTLSVALESVDAAQLDIAALDCFVERLDVLELPSPDSTVHDSLPPEGTIIRQPFEINVQLRPD